METLKFRKSRRLPDLSLYENRKLFLAMNIALIIGGLSLISTFIFLLKNINRADEILWYCLPGFCLGIVIMILYSIGQQKLSITNRQIKRHKIISLER